MISASGSSASQPVNSSSQQDLYVSLKSIHYGQGPPESLRSRPPSPSPTLTCPRAVDPSSLYGSVSGRTSLTPPVTRRPGHNPSPAIPRRNWIQRHNRRPNTVNIDENTMAGIRRKTLKYIINLNPMIHNPLITTCYMLY